MGILRKAADRAARAMPENHTLSTVVAFASSVAHDADLTTVAAATSGLGVAAIVAQKLHGTPEPPEGGYAGFTTDGEKPKRGWRR
ncbi:hypothetical protein PUR71_39540 [Streptomyces sp. SP17BM10]|uniref:hypothetical protein n=1 Tax=Streptomyces sp. SP17BM10 TaxID=3002530 RepID=UPI002E7847ED|nr:hypothetical protein [Streptomyces sp. SP17BM10]MEE1788952.1 hypothetical protein [Streptomyces sp. SP17BM10]